jgi:hypothetical protein
MSPGVIGPSCAHLVRPGTRLRRAMVLAASAACTSLVAACGSGTAPASGEVDPAGMWDARITNAFAGLSGPCTIEWVMAIVATVAGEDRFLDTRVPASATIRCGSGSEGQWSLGGMGLWVRESGDSLAFLMGEADTFMVARVVSNSRLAGRTTGVNYPGAGFEARRRGSPEDINLLPYRLEVTTAWPTLTVGETIELGARLFNAYEQEITDFQIVWLSSAPTVATVSAEGLVHGLAEGSTAIRGTVGELEESITLQVLGP